MPTPFYHLDLAITLLSHPKLSAKGHIFLTNNFPAFWFGKTAPDVQTISGQVRTATHFFTVPADEKSSAWDNLFQTYPHLADSKTLPPSHAAFIAGYICHLQADMIWIKQVYWPYFGNPSARGKPGNSRHLHYILRTWMDGTIHPNLPKEGGLWMHQAAPQDWLPFVADDRLTQWRDFLANQLYPGAESRTAEVFSNRLGISSREFSEMITSETMQARLFSYLPKQVLVEYRKEVIQANLQLLTWYLG